MYDITALFFHGAVVIWAEQINTKPNPPYITLKVGGIQRSAFPILDTENKRYYSCRTTVEVNLYTRGKPITVGSNVTGNYVNTATSDLMDFFNYVESEEITDRMAEKGIEVTLIPPVRDLTALLNDSQYRYRAMAEAVVTFVQQADGSYGICGMPQVPNYSGGGTTEMVEVETGIIERIELESKMEGGNNDYEE